MTEPLDILADVRDLLQILVLAVVEDGVVHDNAVNGVVVVGSQDMLFEIFAVDFAQSEFETTEACQIAIALDQDGDEEWRLARTGSLFFTGACRPIRVHARGRICVREKTDEGGRFVELSEPFSYFGKQAFRDCAG